MFRRKSILWSFVLIVLLVFGFASLTVLLKEPICQGKYLPFMRGWVQFLTPPKDLYKRIDEPLDISTVGNKTLVFTLKYIGPYSINLFPRNIPDKIYGTEYDSPLRAAVEFYIDEKMKLKKDFKYNKLWGLGRGEGIPNCEVNVPSELPIEKSITCLVRVIVPDPYLAENCDMRILIGRRSEE
jgi:hypothetical protein